MKKNILHRIYLLVVILTTGIINAYAGEEHFCNYIKGKHFAADSSLTVQDDKYGGGLWSTIQKNITVTDIVTFELNEDTTRFLIGKHTAKIDLEITYYNAAGVADSLATTLSINYDSTRSKRFNFRSSFKFNGGYKVKARILAVFYDGSLTSHFPKVFTLAEDIYINRVYNFDCSTPQTPTDSFDANNQRLIVSWTPVTGAQQYDLEYTMYDDSSQVIRKDTMNSYSSLDFLFNGNATRVTVQGVDYAFSLVYNPGYIFYRIRPIHYDTLGNRIEGTWSSEISTTIHSFANKYHWKGHENYMNWQYTAAFAELGKRKEVASYFDGTLRNRQSVTLNNSQNKAIVGETIYDFEGRPAVTTLPAPIDSGKLWFYNKFNHDPSDSEYNRKDFDTGDCAYIPVGMDSVRGSSRYYSSSNPDTITGFDRFLPDAQGYPFTMTEYTPDMTGRISRQSIAGKTHRLGSGHETKYFYGKPSQYQLDRLFGSEVGDNSHYLKNMVMDANGQISVSYIDESGKTIATALAGKLPTNLKPIGSYTAGDTITENLLDSAANIRQGTSINSSYVYAVTNLARYYFTYKLFPGNYTDTSCSGAHICTDCLYDVQLMITGDCEGTTPLIIHYDSNLTYTAAFDTSCGHQNIVDTFSVVLSPGNYNITRLISVDPKALNYYTTRFEQKATCIKTYSTFLASAIANTNFSGCNMTCATCLSALGTQSAFINKYITELHSAGESVSTHQDTLNADTAYTRALADCNVLCNASSPCTGLYDEMIADVSPGGQYATYDTAATYTGGDVSSVLNSDFRTPSTPYVNSSGVADSVLIYGVKILPQNLSLKQFVQNWKPSWAGSLVSYHPEYCFYTRCINDSASNRYDNNMENTTTYSAACSQGYFAPLKFGSHRTTCDTTTNADPYFSSTGYGYGTSAWMKHRLEKYVSFTYGGSTVTLSLWATVAVMSVCAQDTLSGVGMAGCYTGSDTNIGSSCSGNANMQWLLFRGLYLNLKQHVQDSLDSVYVTGGGCSAYANCIGINTGSCASTVYDSKTPRHFSLEDAAAKNLGATSPSLATEKTYIDSAMKANCDSTCQSYANNWYQKLSGCGTISPTDSTKLIAGFIAVCEAGCNASHPLGASTTPYSQPDDSGDVSFEDVIHRVLGKSYSNKLCNGSLISMPAPYYDSTGISGAATSFYKPTPCQCGNIDSAYNIYHADSVGETLYKNFGDFLTKYYGDSISEVNAWTLKAMCASSCFFAPAPIQMPLWMSCCQDSSKPQEVTGSGWIAETSVGKTVFAGAKKIFDAVCFSIGDSGYVIGGIMNESTNSDTTLIWNQTTNTWDTGAHESTRVGGIGLAMGNRGFIGLGYNPNTNTWMKDIREYNPHTNTWTTRSTNFPGKPRVNAFAFSIGGAIYVGCGDSLHADAETSSDNNTFYKYDTTSLTWTQEANFPGGKRAGLVGFSIGGYGYAGCGIDSAGTIYNTMWKYNPSSNSWSTIAAFPTTPGVAYPVSFTINSKEYVGMGMVSCPTFHTAKYTNKFWEYNPSSNVWYPAPTFTGTASGAGIGFSIGNYGYAGAGVSRWVYVDKSNGDDLSYSDFGRLTGNDSVQYAAPECCITCSNMDTAMVHFGKVYPSLHDTDANYVTLLTNYLNQYFGFNMTFSNYQQFTIACDSAVLNTIHLHDGKNLPITLCNQSLAQPTPTVDTNSCYIQLMEDAKYNATAEYNSYIDSVQNTFQANYITHCLNIDDSFHVKAPFDEYHYTLYYFDQVGNLVKTVTPQGVHPINLTTTVENNITNYRNKGTGSPTYPVDSLQTHYFYNTLNEPIKQQTPDGDSVHFWYDFAGRICLSQNALQRPLLYSYTQYDAFGRIIEVGQVSTVPQNLPSCFHCDGCTINYGVLPVLPDTFTLKNAELQNFINTGTKTQVTHTYYDTITYPNIPLAQKNLRKRIASITYEEKNDNNVKTYDNSIHYEYDAAGFCSGILVDVPHDSIVRQRYKKINYYYDLVSGNINQIAYEQDSIDQFIHNYEYDADNRLLTVQTSQDSLFWENDASYEYYDHGPLAREVIGRRQVQGLDYVYTLNGWLKGVNSSILNPSFDVGNDGSVHGTNNMVARDAYGYTLDYFNGDYRSIGKTNFEAKGLPITSLYNGNISGATYSIKPLMPKTVGYIYSYDQLNRYVGDSVFKNPDTVNNTWATRTGINDLKEKTGYDENGNILVYLRHGNTMSGGPMAMDSMTYSYIKGKNQLAQVKDAVGASNYTIDIDNQTSKRNYRYNAIGELAKDSAGGLDTLIWNIYGKLKEIKKHNGDSIILFYDPLGNRLEKRYYPHSATADTTKYVRETGGNIIAVYDRKKDTVRLTEWDVYGTKRLGSVDTILRMQKPTVGVGSIDSLTINYLEGQKQYELTNIHLSNVLATISDKKIPIDTISTDTLAKYYLPLIINAQDYYPYGMKQPGRTASIVSGEVYRFDMNGQEKDDSIYGKGNATTAKYWEYNVRLGDRWNIDPKPNAFLSGYATFFNNPILFSDQNGDRIDVTTKDGKKVLFSLDDGKTEITTLTAKQVYDLGIQWFEPLADNYLSLVSVAPDINSVGEAMHFSWSDIVNFATEYRNVWDFRNGGSGDWKQSPQGANGYFLVTVNGMPYWSNAVGSIPFAIWEYGMTFSRTGNYTEAINTTIDIARTHSTGSLWKAILGMDVVDNNSSMDNFFTLRGALFAGQYYTARNGAFGTLGTTNWNPNNLGNSIMPFFSNQYLGMLNSKRTYKAPQKNKDGSKDDNGKKQDKKEFHQNPRFL